MIWLYIYIGTILLSVIFYLVAAIKVWRAYKWNFTKRQRAILKTDFLNWKTIIFLIVPFYNLCYGIIAMITWKVVADRLLMDCREQLEYYDYNNQA